MENIGGYNVPFLAEFATTNIENYTVGHENPNYPSVFPDANASFNYIPADVVVESTYDHLQEPPMFEMQNNNTDCGDINQGNNIDILGNNEGIEGELVLPIGDFNSLPNFGNDNPQSPPGPVPFECCFCQVLRQIIHTNGRYGTKLEIHGRLGIICHAIIRNRLGDGQYEMVNLSTKKADDVREYISQYCEERKQSGFIMLEDPLFAFYDALCPALDVENDISVEDYLDLSPIDLNVDDVPMNDGENYEERRASRGSLSAQRKRSADLTVAELSHYFGFPMEEAARRIGLCPTVLKTFCRRHGLGRWPHRKLKSLERQQQALEPSLRSNDPNIRAEAERQFRIIQEKIDEIYGRQPAA